MLSLSINSYSILKIDPSEKLEPEVEDILVDIAEEFVESVSNYILHVFFVLTCFKASICQSVVDLLLVREQLSSLQVHLFSEKHTWLRGQCKE